MNLKMKKYTMPMRWSKGATLELPATGQVVKEAHLVTDKESYPKSQRAGLTSHYKLSEIISGYSCKRTGIWAPIEGGSHYGSGCTGRRLPVIDEAWYICMNWRKRPPKSTRFIVTNPANGKIVVCSAGWETGPGRNTAIAGVSEETHAYLGTKHRSILIVGEADDQTLPLGPLAALIWNFTRTEG